MPEYQEIIYLMYQRRLINSPWGIQRRRGEGSNLLTRGGGYVGLPKVSSPHPQSHRDNDPPRPYPNWHAVVLVQHCPTLISYGAAHQQSHLCPVRPTRPLRWNWWTSRWHRDQVKLPVHKNNNAFAAVLHCLSLAGMSQNVLSNVLSKYLYICNLTEFNGGDDGTSIARLC